MDVMDSPASPSFSVKDEESNVSNASSAESIALRSSKSLGSFHVTSMEPGSVDNGYTPESVPGESFDADGHSLQPQKEMETQPLVVSRSEEYRQLFHLPPEEVLVKDFNCAMQTNILLQGHMYLFVLYVCFYSNIFGYEKKKIIPLRDITSVQKARTAGIFPNAIEIVAWGKKHFFASFLSRDEAYRLIVDGWSRHSEHAKCFLGSQDSTSNNSSPDPSFVSFDRLPSPQTIGFSDTNIISRDIEEAPREVEEPNHEATDHDRVCTLIDELEMPERSLRSIFEEETLVQSASLAHSHTSNWQVEDEDAPNVPEYYKMVVESKFPIDVEKFYQLFFSNDATGFAAEYHRKCRDEDFQCTPWQKHRHFGHVRDVSFRHPINLYFGSRFTHCQEVQRFRVYRNSHLVVETSQQMNDIPYGDHFRVEGLWDVERVSATETNQCILRIFVNVAFSRKTFFKGKIEQGTCEECKETYSTWIRDAHAILKEMGKESVKTLNEVPSFTAALENQLTPGFELPDENGKSANPVKAAQSAIAKTSSRSQDSCGRLHSVRTHEQELQQESNVMPGNDKSQNIVETSMTKSSGNGSESSSLLPHVYSSVSLHWKRWSQYSIILVLLFAAILVITQIGILILLARYPNVQYVPPVSHPNAEDMGQGLRGSSSMEMAAWLEQRVYYLKEEMSMAEARLKSIQHEFTLLKMHLQVLDRLNLKLQPDAQNLPYSA